MPNPFPLPRVTFGMIVLNGEPFTRYNLRALYPFAHQIVVVEGACPSAKSVATEDGHSRDETLEVLRGFQASEDAENKLIIVTAEDEGYPDGFWPEKDEMSQAYARRATGNYLWQIDADEFYRPQDMQAILDMLRQNSDIMAVTFRVLTFWGGLAYRTDGLFLRAGAQDFHRLFAWRHNYRYLTHRPPTVVDERGLDLRKIKAVSGEQLAQAGIYMYHYELLFPKQVLEKVKYYAGATWTDLLPNAEKWAEKCYLELQQPYHVHMVYKYASWLERYKGAHPPEVVKMINAVQSAEHLGVRLRRTDDIEYLLARPSYRVGRVWLKVRSHVEGPAMKLRGTILQKLRRTPVWPFVRRARSRLIRKAVAKVSND